MQNQDQNANAIYGNHAVTSEGAHTHPDAGAQLAAATKAGHVPQFQSPQHRAEALILNINMAESIARADLQAQFGDDADVRELEAHFEKMRTDVMAVMAFELAAVQRARKAYHKALLSHAKKEALPDDFDAATFLEAGHKDLTPEHHFGDREG